MPVEPDGDHHAGGEAGAYDDQGINHNKEGIEHIGSAGSHKQVFLHPSGDEKAHKKRGQDQKHMDDDKDPAG